MPNPSLLIVPARFKTGRLYSQIPSNTDNRGDFNVTRATAATRVNSAGLIESVASGIPRLDYFASGGTVGCPALLVEPSAQNLAFHSTNWTSNWDGGSASGTTVVTNSAISLAPDGTATANEIYPTSGNTNHLRSSNSTTAVTYVSGTVYTQSAFFKAGVGVGSRIQLTFTSLRFTQLGYANFDLSAGTVLVVSGTTADTNRAASIENYGNGWYRCSFKATCSLAGTGIGVVATLISASGDTRTPLFSGTVTDYVLGWGAQLETGSVATSYIPTTTGSVTRNADVVSVSGAVSGAIGQTEGTIYAEVDVRTLGEAKNILQIDDGTATNRIGLFVDISPTRLTLLMSSGGVANSVSGSVTTGITKIAASYSSGNVQVFTNGSFLVSGTIATYPTITLNDISVGSRISSGVYGVFLNDRIRAVALYTTRLTNAELAALTTP